MESDERVTALKKAYADMILNTAKEAAARVMVSERKAQRFEHELKLAKEEGLRMLLRIKQIMDAKVFDLEVTALSQKKNIDELEAQLHEAEDIVRDLREELREVQSELERLKSGKARCFEKRDIPTHGPMEINRLYPSQLTEFRPHEMYGGSIFSHPVGHAFTDQRIEARNCYRTSIYGGYSTGESPDLPSIISRRKAPLFYRNGCTQRILACGKDELDQELSFSTSIDNTKDRISIKEVVGGKVTCSLQIQENENGKALKKTPVKDNSNSDCSLINKTNGAANQLKKESPSQKQIFGESTRTDQDPPCSGPNSASDDAHSSDDRSETSTRVFRKKGGLSMHSDCSRNSDSEGKLVNCITDQQNMESGDSSDIMDPAKASPSPVELEPNESEGGDCLPKPTINDKLFRYTFQRKRKRDILVNENESPEHNFPEEYIPSGSNKIFDESCDLDNIASQGNGKPKVSTSNTITDTENNTFSRDVAEEQNTSIHLPKSICVIESPQQLISMTDKGGSTVSPENAE